jgi:hypothetical protein
MEFKTWILDRKNRITHTTILIIGMMTSFKVVRSLYSRYFGFSFFKLKLSSIDQLFYINVLTGVSAATLSLIFIGSGAGTSYDDSSKGQTFFFGLDCVLVTIVMIIFTICEVQKE